MIPPWPHGRVICGSENWGIVTCLPVSNRPTANHITIHNITMKWYQTEEHEDHEGLEPIQSGWNHTVPCCFTLNLSSQDEQNRKWVVLDLCAVSQAPTSGGSDNSEGPRSFWCCFPQNDCTQGCWLQLTTKDALNSVAWLLSFPKCGWQLDSSHFKSILTSEYHWRVLWELTSPTFLQCKIHPGTASVAV